MSKASEVIKKLDESKFKEGDTVEFTVPSDFQGIVKAGKKIKGEVVHCIEDNDNIVVKFYEPVVKVTDYRHVAKFWHELGITFSPAEVGNIEEFNPKDFKDFKKL